MNSYPYQIAPIFKVDKGNLRGIEFILEGREDKVVLEAIQKIIMKLENLGCLLRYQRISEIVDGEALYLAVVDAGCFSSKDVVGELKGLDGVKSVSVIEPENGLIYSRKLYPPVLFEGRVILTGPASMEGVIIETRKQLGRVADVVINRVGYFVGKRIGEAYSSSYLKDRKHSSIKKFLELFSIISGWGVLEEYYVERDGTIVLKLRDLWEKWIMDRNGIRGRPEYTLGMINGFFETILGRPVKVHYTKQWEGTKESLLFFVAPD